MARPSIFRTVKRIVLALLTTILVAVGTLAIYLPTHLKAVLQELVKQETDNEYNLDFSNISLSLINGTGSLENAQLKPSKSIQSANSYSVKLSHVYFSLGSLKEFVFKNRLEIDSCIIKKPVFSINLTTGNNGDTATEFETQHIYEEIKDVTEKLGVRILEIRDASISISHQDRKTEPLEIDHLDLKLKNFSTGSDRTRFFFTDEFKLNIKNQNWNLSGGHRLTFRNLAFSGKTKYLELDSCTLSTTDPEGDSIAFSSERFVFAVKNFYNFIESQDLTIDTVFILSPVWYISVKSGDKESVSLEESISSLFGKVKCHLIHVQDGQIAMNISGKQQGNYQSNRTDLKIAGLEIDPVDSPHIRVADIALHLQETSMITPDSLYKLDIKDFGIEGNTLICKNATFEPTGYDKTRNDLHVSIPSFKLLNISLVDLLEKRLKASVALVDYPLVRLASFPKQAKNVKPGLGMKDFYQMLHDFGELVNVERLQFTNGKISYEAKGPNGFKVTIDKFETEIKLRQLLASSSLLDSKLSIPLVKTGTINMQSKKIHFEATDMVANGTEQTNTLRSFVLRLPSGLTIHGEGAFWKQFSWDSAVMNHDVVIDSLDFKKIIINSPPHPITEADETNVGPRLLVRKIKVHDSDLKLTTANGSQVKATGKEISIDSAQILNGTASWERIRTNFNNVIYSRNHQLLVIGHLLVSNYEESVARDAEFSDGKNAIFVQEVKFRTDLSKPELDKIRLPYLVINGADMTFDSDTSTQTISKQNVQTDIPSINITRFELNKGVVRYASVKDLYGETNVNVRIDSFSLGHGSGPVVKFAAAEIVLDSSHVQTKKLPLTFSNISVTANNGIFRVDSASSFSINTLMKLQWNLNGFEKKTDKTSFTIKSLSGIIDNYPLALRKGDKLDIKTILNSSSFNFDEIVFKDSAITLTASNISGSGTDGSIAISNVKLNPNISREQFFRNSTWQKDYLTFSSENVRVEKFDVPAFLRDSSISIQKLLFNGAILTTSRDKNITFQHDVEKLMPTKATALIKASLKIDSIQLKNASVMVHEISKITGKEAIVPITHLNAVITNFGNTPNADSLFIDANAVVFDYRIRRFRYAESYNDSLSGFKLRFRFSPMDLRKLSDATINLAAVAVKKGKADTLYARATGNKYAAFGEMNFPYRNLKIKFLDKKNTSKSSIAKGFVTFVANSFVVKSKNKEQSNIFYVRDSEKFIFNYWVKTLLSGILTSAGVKSNKKYEQLLEQIKSSYSLPVLD